PLRVSNGGDQWRPGAPWARLRHRGGFSTMQPLHLYTLRRGELDFILLGLDLDECVSDGRTGQRFERGRDGRYGRFVAGQQVPVRFLRGPKRTAGPAQPYPLP